jgi:hypothetical protein
MMTSRDFAAVALAPAVAPALLFVWLSVSAQQEPTPVETAFATAAMLAGCAYVVTLLVGLPLWALFRAGVSRCWQFLAVGAMLGAVFGASVTGVAVVLYPHSFATFLADGIVPFVLTFGTTWGLPVGTVTGLMFWLMIRPSW